MEPVTFKNKDRVVAGNLHLPLPFDDAKKYPALICVHPSGASREQAAHDYGLKLTQLGYVTLVLDATARSATGEEVGSDPAGRIENIRCAIDYLVTMAFVDEGHIVAVGLGSGAGYLVGAAMSDCRIAALAAVSPVDVGRIQREGDLSAGAAAERLREIGHQRTAEARGAAPKIVGLLPVAKAGGSGSARGLDLVEAVGTGPKAGGAQTAPDPADLSLADLGAVFVFDAFHLAEQLLGQPLLVIIGDTDGPFGSYRDGFRLFDAARSEQKEIDIIEQCNHNDFYNDADRIGAVVTKVGQFFKNSF